MFVKSILRGAWQAFSRGSIKFVGATSGGYEVVRILLPAVEHGAMLRDYLGIFWIKNHVAQAVGIGYRVVELL